MGKLLEGAQLDTAQIDRLIQTKGLENILTNRNLDQYFRLAQSGLLAITDSFNTNKSLSGAAPDLKDYGGYWGTENDTYRGTAGLDYIPREYLFDTRLMAQWAGFNEREAGAYHVMMNGSPAASEDAPAEPAAGGGKGMAVRSSTSKNLGAPPGGGGGYPPGGGGYGGGGYSPQNMNYFPQAEWNWAQQNLQGMAGADWLTPLFGANQRYREVVAYGTQELNELDNFQRQIMTEFQTLDMTTPEGQRRQFVLMQEVQSLGGRRQEIMDKMMRVQRYHDELMSGLKGLKDKASQVLDDIIRNTRVG
jgi:hypothetical protein